MASFAVELYWPGMTTSLVDELVARVRRAVPLLDGAPVRYMGCTIAPGDEVCFLRVEAANAEQVAELVERLGLDGARVAEMLDMPGPRHLRRR